MYEKGLKRKNEDGVDVGKRHTKQCDDEEGLVNEISRRSVLEGLKKHDVATVAGGVPDREEDRDIYAPGLVERFGAPLGNIVARIESIGKRKDP